MKSKILMSNGKENLKAKNNIFLIGFMASGKTTIGEILANKLGRKFIDTDKLIENKIGLSISEIFQNKGELHFREIESEVIKNVSILEEAVIAIGGGTIVNPQNWQLIKNAGYTIYLQWDIDLLIPKLIKDNTRPMISQKMKKISKNEIIELFISRKYLYERADYSINCVESDTPGQITNTIMKILSLENAKYTCYSRT